MSWRPRINVWLSLLVLVPVLPLFSFWVYSTYSYTIERRDSIEAGLIRYADAVAGSIRDRIENSYGYVSSLAASKAARQGDIPGLYAFARRIQDNNPHIRAISLIAPDERMVFLSLRPLGERFPTGASDSVRKVFATGRPDLSGPFRSPISEAMVVALSVPIVHEGRVAYCLRAILTTASINDILAAAGLPQDWIATAVDTQGTIVARSLDPDQHVGQHASPRTLEAIRRADHGLWPGVTRDGIPTQTVLRPIGNWGWNLSLGVPTRTLIAPLEQEMWRIVCIGVLLFGTSAVAVLWMSRRIALGLRDAVDATDAMLQGRPVAVHASHIRELDQMHQSLTEAGRYQLLLEQRVLERTRELAEARERAQDFAAELQNSVESERRRIAREVHDQIGAAFTGIKMIFAGLPRNSLDPAQARTLMEALDGGLQTARRIAAELRPPLMDDLGLESAIRLLLEQQLEPLGIRHEVALAEQEVLDDQQAIGCYRIVQEACTNVMRHAHASTFSVRGRRVSAADYEVTLQDDGQGMPPGLPRKGALGLMGMQERALLLGGTLRFAAAPGGGTLLTLRLPLRTSP